MSVQLRLRRGSRTDHDGFTGAEGEITYVTDEQTLRVHDGATVGGHTVAGGFSDAPVDGNEYLRKDGTWVQPSAGGVADAPVDGTLYGRRDGGWVEVTPGGSSDAASTTFDNGGSNLAATDVKAALDELDARTGAPIVAVVAGDDATQAVKDATAYVETTDDGGAQIASALAAGYRVLYLVGTVSAESMVTIGEPASLAIEGAPGARLDGDLTVDTAGDPITLDVTVTGTVSDPNGRIVRRPKSDPTAIAGANAIANIVALTQAEYDALGTLNAATLYVVTDAS